MSPAYSLYTDGGARGNPGPAGAGAVLLDPKGVEAATVSEYIGELTNNQAEYIALIMGLGLAQAAGVQELRVYADSELMVRQIQGVYKVKHPDLKPLFEKAKDLIAKIPEFQIAHVRREQNARADELVNQALDAHS